MKFKCPYCQEVINYDMRLKINKLKIGNRNKITSFCEKIGKTVYVERLR